MTGYNKFSNNSGTTIYRDFDLSFLPNPNTADIRIKTDVDSIKQAIRILLFTNSGERPFQPNLAGNLSALLFQPLDVVTTIVLQRSIASVLRAYEPRISVIGVKVSPDSNPNTINVTVTFRILNQPAIQSVQVLIGRKR